TTFLHKEDYFSLLSSCKVAIFGHRRQEAGNNIFFLLGMGTKIFLRPENNLLHYLKKRGFLIYNYYSLKSLSDLVELTPAEKAHNLELLKIEFNQEKIEETYK